MAPVGDNRLFSVAIIFHPSDTLSVLLYKQEGLVKDLLLVRLSPDTVLTDMPFFSLGNEPVGSLYFFTNRSARPISVFRDTVFTVTAAPSFSNIENSVMVELTDDVGSTDLVSTANKLYDSKKLEQNFYFYILLNLLVIFF